MTFRIWVALEILQYLDNHEPQRFDFCIEWTPTDRTCQLYHHQVKIMIIYEGTNNLVSGAFLKCFSILLESNAEVFFVLLYLYMRNKKGRVAHNIRAKTPSGMGQNAHLSILHRNTMGILPHKGVNSKIYK